MKTKKKTKLLMRKPANAKAKARNKIKRLALRGRRPLHKKILLHPLAVFGLLCLGVILTASTLDANAATFSVNGVLPAAPLTVAATTNQPQNGTTVTQTPITVHGDCPQGSYVELIRNGYFSGAAICPQSQSYQITTDLTPGTNTLNTQAYNVTNQAGPESAGVTVTYQATPTQNTNNPATGSNVTGGNTNVVHDVTVEAANSPSPDASNLFNHSGFGTLLLGADYSYHAFTTASSYTWGMDLTGGTPPYVVNVAWGDGTSSSLFFKTDPYFSVQHQYTKVGTYNILVSCVDSLGEKVVTQLSSIIKSPQTTTNLGVTKLSGTNPGNSSTLSSLDVLKSAHHYLWLMWPSYGIIMLMVFSFWLGERRELEVIVLTSKRSHR